MFLKTFFPDNFFESLYFPETFPHVSPGNVLVVGGNIESNSNSGEFNISESLFDYYIEHNDSGIFDVDDIITGRTNKWQH